MDLFLLIILVICVIVFSGLVSGSEAAILSISYPKVKELLSESKKKEKKRLEILIYIKDNLQSFITTLVVLNNIINIVGSIYVGYVASQIFGDIYLGVISAALTFAIIIFSEIIPKVYGERYSEKISPRISYPLLFVYKTLYPLIFVLNRITKLFIRGESTENHVSEGIIREMALLGKQEGSINQYESELIENVFEMDDIEVYDIMVPKNKVAIINLKTTFQELLSLAKDTGFTRFPVLNEKDDIIGLVNVKDLFRFYDNEKNFSVTKILRPIEFAPEAMKISTLEMKLRRNKTHMAVIVNEHGDFTGIATLEDIFEELLGDIEDEFDDEDEIMMKQIDNRKYSIDGSYDIEELNDELDLSLELEDNYSTLNGFIVDKLGRIPKLNEVIAFKTCSFKVTQANKRQILRVELLLK